MSEPIVVVGAGMAGLSAALALAGRGARVRVLEAAPVVGGKVGTVRVGELEFDTGPSVLTMVSTFEELFALAGARFDEHVELTRPEHNFRYFFPSGARLDVAVEYERTLAEVEGTFGAKAASEFDGFLAYSREIWEAAFPHFVAAQAPDLWNVLRGGPKAWTAIARIDGLRTMRQAVAARVKTPELRMLLERYATYNGSDVRRAPGTLNCIAHVELELGGFGVRGGMARLVAAVVERLESLGVEIETSAAVEEVQVRQGRVVGVSTARGAIDARAVVLALEANLLPRLLPNLDWEAKKVPSMSGYCAVFASRTGLPRAAHSVVFPSNYEEEFADIFDERRTPRNPTVYACDQTVCHGRAAQDGRSPVFAMVNAPGGSGDLRPTEVVVAEMRERLAARGLLEEGAECLWSRGPRELAERFPGSDGALYGSASNDAFAAFRRQPSRIRGVRGVYFAHGSGHPGGGLPMVARSGMLAAEALAVDGFGERGQA